MIIEKNTFIDQVFITFNDLPKAIRTIDNKNVFYRESNKYYRTSCFLTLILNYRLYWLISLWVLEFQFWYSTCNVYFLSWMGQNPSAIC